MATPILTTKLYIPAPRPELVPRPRLIERLNEGLRRKLTLISAPAGFGKTTLVSEWIYETNNESIVNQIAWLSLDEGDNDPTRFLAYFIAALQTVEANLGQGALAALQAPQAQPPESIIALLINEIATFSTSISLVLDDYHVIQTQAIHEALIYLLDHCPPQLHLIISSRDEPLLALPRLRIRDELTELRAADLAFAAEEAVSFFNQVMDLNISPAEVAALEGRTEGWIAGLQVAGLSLKGRSADDQAHFIKAFTGSHRYILDYLADEVLRRQPPAVQDFLLQTAILNRLCGSLCQAVTGQKDSQSILEQLEAANLFLIPLDDERRWYRYHHLFQDFLGHLLAQRYPEIRPQLYQRASGWFEQNDLLSEAIEMALAADDFSRVADLIEQTAQTTVWQQGQWTSLLHWLETLPPQIINTRPRLSVYHAWGIMTTGDFEAVEARLQQAEQSIRSDSLVAAAINGQIAAIRSTVARVRGDLGATVALSRQALEILPQEETFWRASTALNLGAIYFLGDDLALAQQMLAEAKTEALAADIVTFAIVAFGYSAQLEVRRGRLGQAVSLYQQALALTQQHESAGQTNFTTGMPYIGLGDLYRERNELGAAVHHLEQGLALGRQVNSLLVLVSGHIALARVKQAQGDQEAAQIQLQQAEQVANQLEVAWSWLHTPVTAYLIRLWLNHNQIETANQTAQAWQQKDDAPLLPGYWTEGQQIALARLFIGQNNYSEALVILEPAAQAAKVSGSVGSLIEILVLQTVAHAALANPDKALRSLQQALSFAEPAGYIRLFIDEGDRLAPLLQQAIARNLQAGYATKLLQAIRSETKTGPTSATSQLLDPLTERELEVLRLIVAGLSNQAIADELVIAHGTVRQHINRIYSKLDVKSRAQAIIKAQDLDLV